jgi:hypothetical protein
MADQQDTRVDAEEQAATVLFSLYDNNGLRQRTVMLAARDTGDVLGVPGRLNAEGVQMTPQAIILAERLRGLTVRRSRGRSFTMVDGVATQHDAFRVAINGVTKLTVTSSKSVPFAASEVTTEHALSLDEPPETVYFCDQNCFDDFVDWDAIDDEQTEATQYEIDEALAWVAAVDYAMTALYAERELEYLSLTQPPDPAAAQILPTSVHPCVVAPARAAVFSADGDCTAHWVGFAGAVGAVVLRGAEYAATMAAPPPVSVPLRVARAVIWRGRRDVLSLASAVVGTSIALKQCIDEHREQPSDMLLVRIS